jgi:hypothetical protein
MSNAKEQKRESWDGVVLLESSSIEWKSNDGPKPITVRRAFASTEWENHILSARHIQALAASKIPSSNITAFMKVKALPADTLPTTNDNVDLAFSKNTTKMYIFKCPGVKTGRVEASRLCLFMQYDMLAEEANSCGFMLEQYCNGKSTVIAVGCAKQRRLLANTKPIPCHACDDIDGKRLKQRINKMKKIEDVLEELKQPRVSDIGRQAVAAFKKTPLKHKLNLLI